MDNTKKTAILNAVSKLKTCQFKTTGIKVELEAQFNRRNSRSHGRVCEYCDHGEVDCSDCEGSGEIWCCDCDGTGEIRDVDGTIIDCPTCSDDDCDDVGYMTCGYCEGSGRQTCCECDGNYQIDDGCDDEDAINWNDNNVCYSYLMERLSGLGLAELRDEERVIRHSGMVTNWYPVHPLKYAEFYTDGSVDSEFTFTLSLRKKEYALLLPKIVEIWNDLGREIGQDVVVTGAGLHMALINTPNCIYPSSTHDYVRYDNFQKSMTLLMPALYFLGSSNKDSRPLRYRLPAISDSNKYSAVAYRGGSLEFRVFDTCYDNPDNILDNLVVMSNCMKYWTERYTRNFLDKITTQTRFGVDGNNELKRFYVTSEHIDLLNRGLRLIKPEYYTIKQVKEQREFCVTKRQTKRLDKTIREEAEKAYKEYEYRFGWNMVLKRNSFINRYIEEHAHDGTQHSEAELLPLAEQYATELVATEETRKIKLDTYVEEETQKFYRNKVGQYDLAI